LEGQAACRYLPRIEWGSKALESIEASRVHDPAVRAQAREEFSGLVLAAGLKLTDRDRRVLFARAEKLPYSAISEILGTTPGAARLQALTARRKLRRAGTGA
jgi:DNA-directed RNA polymerase specialized sigma24 family protein